jgi:hypothetical protein
VNDEFSYKDSTAGSPQSSYESGDSDWGETNYTYDDDGQLTSTSYASFVDPPLSNTSQSYLCSCQPRGVDFFGMFREVRSRGAGWFSFSHRSMAA